MSAEQIDYVDERITVGDIVDVKGIGRATVIETQADSPESPHFGRYRVRYHEDNTTYWCRPKRMRKMYPSNKRVLVARSTYAYRDAMIHNVDRSDICLEIGCHEGLTTHIISKRTAFVAGIDTAADVITIARRRHPHLTLHQLNGLDVAATAALSPTGTFTRICIDISGKAPLQLVCSMIAAQCAAFPTASLIVKNEELFDALIARHQTLVANHQDAHHHHHHPEQPPQRQGSAAEQGSQSALSSLSPPQPTKPTLKSSAEQHQHNPHQQEAQQDEGPMDERAGQDMVLGTITDPHQQQCTVAASHSTSSQPAATGNGNAAHDVCSPRGPQVPGVSVGGEEVLNKTRTGVQQEHCGSGTGRLTRDEQHALVVALRRQRHQPPHLKGGVVEGKVPTAATSVAMVAAANSSPSRPPPPDVSHTPSSDSGDGALEGLLGLELLAQCDVFRHQFMTPRSRPPPSRAQPTLASAKPSLT